MEIATDIAEDASDRIFDAAAADPRLQQSLRQLEARDGKAHKAGFVIEMAAFNLAGDEVTFSGEFDFHGGWHLVHRGEPAIRANVTGTLRQVGNGWAIRQISVLDVQDVDAADAPDEVHAVIGERRQRRLGLVERLSEKLARTLFFMPARRGYAGPDRRSA